MQSTDSAPLYTIQDMRPEMLRNPDGSYAPAYRVDFQTATGHRSHVIVPRSATLDADIHAAVDAEAQQIIKAVTRSVGVYSSSQLS